VRPGQTPDRSPGGTLFGVLWMLSQALVFGAVGEAIGVGVKTGKRRHAPRLDVRRWSASGGAGLQRQDATQVRRLELARRVVSDDPARRSPRGANGYRSPATIPSGDVVNTVASDAMRIGGCYDVSARFAGAVVSWLVIAAILLTSSLRLGAVVLVGVRC